MYSKHFMAGLVSLSLAVGVISLPSIAMAERATDYLDALETALTDELATLEGLEKLKKKKKKQKKTATKALKKLDVDTTVASEDAGLLSDVVDKVAKDFKKSTPVKDGVSSAFADINAALDDGIAAIEAQLPLSDADVQEKVEKDLKKAKKDKKKAKKEKKKSDEAEKLSSGLKRIETAQKRIDELEPPPAGVHRCTLDDSQSKINIILAALVLPVAPAGAIDFTCGAVDAETGKAECTCDIVNFAPIVIPGIGDVCVSPVSGCDPGEIDCDGGNALDVDALGDHNIGSCSGNTDCGTQCGTFCGSAAVIDSGCEGFCEGGANDGNSCTLDAECTGGNCVGGEPVAHAGTCNCSCGESGLGNASPAGSLSCNLGLQINVELPSNGTCGDPASIVLPPVCGPISTTSASGTIENANNNGICEGGPSDGTPCALGGTSCGVGVCVGGSTGAMVDINGPLTGAPIACADFENSVTSGLAVGGYLTFFDSTLGDILAGNSFVCQ